MNKKHVHIFTATDDNYVPYLMVTVKSVSLHSSDNYVYDIYVLNKGLAPQNVRKLRHLDVKNINIMLVNVERAISGFGGDLSRKLRDYYSEAIFYRMFIASMYPRLARAVYIDCDVVLVDDIAKLYFTNIGDSVLGAVTDESVARVPEFSDYVRNWVGVPARDYINSGVLLINLSAYRRCRILERFERLVVEKNFDTVAPDQDYLNYLCRGRIHYLDGGWNKHPMADDPLPAAEQHLIHYNFYKKPWHYDGVPYSDVFWDVARTTPYYADMVREFVEYTDEERERDAEGGVRLVQRAWELAGRSGGFADCDECALEALAGGRRA